MSTKSLSFGRKLSLLGLGKERNFFLENFSHLLVSGMPIADAMAFVAEEIQSKTLKKIVLEMAADIQSWLPLSETMEKTGLFSAHVITLVRIGQESWRLNENIQIVVNEQKKSGEMRSKIRSALMYPMFVLVLVLVVGTGIAWFILPKLTSVFQGLNLKIPAVTKALLDFGTFLDKNGLIAVPLFFLTLGGLFYVLFFYERTRKIGEVFLFHCPGIKRLMKEAALEQFGFLLGTLLNAGLSPLDALDSLVKSTAVTRYKKMYQFFYSSLADGFSFKQSFKMYPKADRLIPSSIQQVVISGEQSGVLPETLLKLWESYERKIEATTKDLSVMLEPIMLIVVWVGVVGLALAVILPIYDLIWGIR